MGSFRGLADDVRRGAGRARGDGNLSADAVVRQGERRRSAAGEDADLARSGSSLGVFLRYWLPVLVYVAIIFALSSIANLTPPVRWENADKAAHLAEYALLGFLLVRAFFGAGVFPALVACGLLALSAGLATGIADECFQAGISGRVSSVADFRADALGVLIGVTVYSLARRLRGD